MYLPLSRRWFVIGEKLGSFFRKVFRERMTRWPVDYKIWTFFLFCMLVTIVECESMAYAYPHTNVIPNPYTESQIPLALRIRKRNYPVEIHTVNTTDGYILSLYRVPHGPNENNSKNRSVVLLIHGMGGSPTMFWLYEKYSLGYYLVNKGFDVWSLCARGLHCAHEKKHVKYDWDVDKKYWDFSMHEIGTIDIPAHVDYVREQTGYNKLHLVGHSAGNTAMFIMLAERPEYNDKAKTAVAYAPSVILKSVDYPLVEFTAAMVKILKGLYKMLGMVEFTPSIENFKGFFHTACADKEYYPVCVHMLSIVGSHMSVLANNKELLPFLIQDAGFRCSSKQIFHYLECIDSGEFRKYDYGTKKNLRLYGQETPPKYNLSAIATPSGFFYAGGDSICTEEDVQATMDEMPNVVYDFKVPFRKFTHTDFIFAKEAAKWVYEPTARLFKDYDNGILPPRRISRLEKQVKNNEL